MRVAEISEQSFKVHVTRYLYIRSFLSNLSRSRLLDDNTSAICIEILD